VTKQTQDPLGSLESQEDFDSSGTLGSVDRLGHSVSLRHGPKHPGFASTVATNINKTPVIAHIDMDAFFVSVSTRDKPHLVDKPGTNIEGVLDFVLLIT